jgi:hypothetical protein
MRRIHLVRTSGSSAGRTAGCNRNIQHSNFDFVDEPEQLQNIAEPLIKCTYCFKLYDYPSTWRTVPISPCSPPSMAPTSSASSSSGPGSSPSPADDPPAPTAKRRKEA